MDKEIEKIKDRLDEGENVIHTATQSRIKVGGARIVNPNTIFLTEKRVIIRNPIKLGFGERIEEYAYHQITNIEVEVGMFSASLIFAIEGLTEMSKLDRKSLWWGRETKGVIDAIPKEKAVEMYDYIRKKISLVKAISKSEDDGPLQILKTRYAKGKITKEEFEEMKKDLE